MIIFIIITAGVLLYFLLDTIMLDRSIKEHNNRIIKKLEKLYDGVEIFIIGVFTSIFSWDDDLDDDDLDTKTK